MRHAFHYLDWATKLAGGAFDDSKINIIGAGAVMYGLGIGNCSAARNGARLLKDWTTRAHFDPVLEKEFAAG
jgi:hypothetical protein